MPNNKRKGRGKDARAGGEFRGQDSEAFAAALAAYEQALELMRRGEFAEARDRFLAVATDKRDEPVLSDRARTWAAACGARVAPPAAAPTTADERYREAVGRLNDGKYREAMPLLDAAIASAPEEGSYWYARAVAKAGLRDAEAAASDLRKAVALIPHLRYQAAQDSDFEPIRDEAAFIDVIEPSPAGA